MACHRSPPSSPRAPKIQQQSWDDCGTPPISLFDPTNVTSSPPRSPSRGHHYDSPKSPRKPNAGYYNESRSPKSPRKFTYSFEQQRSPKFDFDDGYDVQPPLSQPHQQHQQAPRSPKITYSNGDGDDFFDKCAAYVAGSYTGGGGGGSSTCSSGGGGNNHQPNYSSSLASPRRSPKSPKKFVFDAVSPRGDGRANKFEHYDPVSPDYDDTFKFCDVQPKTSNTPCSSTATTRQSKINTKMLVDIGFCEKKIVAHRPLVATTITSAPGPMSTATTANSIATCSSGSGGGSSCFTAKAKRNSAATESTVLGCESDMSAATTVAICDGVTGCEASECNEETGRHSASRRRRLAINITANPGYQVLHTSHSTLDRTCSDSVVSLRMRCRKSTSDLTDEAAAATPPPVVSDCNSTGFTSHRRGSKGLAFLASRRNSRDSIKSAVSNASIFSNEDLGPLAFQASARGRQRRTSNFLELPIPDHIRPRVCSLPERPYNPRHSDDLYRLRTFSISKGTVVNCGDSIISRRSRSNTSVNSTNSRASERSPFDGSCCGGGYGTVDSLPPSPTTDSDEPEPSPRYRVVMMGDAGVGKTALVSQFMTSEYMHTYDASLDDEFGEKTVSILLDGEESEMIFIDHPSTEMSVENSLSTYEPHGCVVVYSVVQRSSFRQAEDTINYLCRENVTRDKAVILVGNKADLARSRVIPAAEGKSLAQSKDSKFIETSSGIQHNVDELLVGILKQIRLRETRDKKAAAHTALKMRNSKTHMSLHIAKEILQKICLSDISKSKSCENLHVL